MRCHAHRVMSNTRSMFQTLPFAFKIAATLDDYRRHMLSAGG